jgi:cytidyltransferase-like protein
MTTNKNKEKYSIGMVFGVFDGFHLGHKYFLEQAQKKCDKLIVVITHDDVVELLKNHKPKYSFEKRLSAIKKFNKDFIAIQGDENLGNWNAIKKYNPNIVFVGHDQIEISKELEKMKIPYIFLDSYLPEQYKSSLL